MAINFNLLNGPQKKVLRGALVAGFSRAEFDGLLRDAGFGPLENHTGNEAFPFQVQGVIDGLARRGELNELVGKVLEERGQNSELRSLEQRLGWVEVLPPEGIDFSGIVREAIGSGSAPRLAARKLELQRLVNDGGFFDTFLWTGLLEEASERVCRISFPVNGQLAHGSGFLVGPDLVLTNYHVVEPILEGDASVESVRCVFDFAEKEGGPSSGVAYSLAPEWLLASGAYSDSDIGKSAGLPGEKELDFALLRLEGEAGDSKRGWVRLPRQAVTDWKRRGSCYVLQHPLGKALKHTIGWILDSPTPLRVRYDADSAKGSSGGLVLVASTQAAALHHAGDPRKTAQAEYNQGIPLHLIRKAIEDARPGVLQ